MSTFTNSRPADSARLSWQFSFLTSFPSFFQAFLAEGALRVQPVWGIRGATLIPGDSPLNQTRRMRSGCSRSVRQGLYLARLRECRISREYLGLGWGVYFQKLSRANRSATVRSTRQSCHRMCTRTAGGNAFGECERKVPANRSSACRAFPL